MVARHDTHTHPKDLWGQLSAPLAKALISWRQDGKVVARDGKFYARFVPYVDANTVRARLDSVVPGEWDLTLESLPPLPNEDGGTDIAFKARLQILGVIREDVGTGKDYKAAATDAFKRAATRFGIANELYDYGQNWVPMDGDGRNAKPAVDPGEAYARRYGDGGASTNGSSAATPAAREPAPARRQETGDVAERKPAGEPIAYQGETVNDEEAPACPKCGGRMWDNRLSKRNPKAPDFKCRDRACDGVIWPPRQGGGSRRTQAVDTSGPAFPGDPGESEFPPLDPSPLGASVDDIPF